MTLAEFIAVKMRELAAYELSCGEREVVPDDAAQEEWEIDFEQWRSEI